MTNCVYIVYCKDNRHFHCRVPDFEQNLPTSKKYCHLSPLHQYLLISLVTYDVLLPHFYTISLLGLCGSFKAT